MFQTASVIASGLGYNGRAPGEGSSYYGEHRWDKFIGVYLTNAETAPNVNYFLANWNYRVHVWLKHYVQERIVEQGKRPNSTQYLTIFMISAFWHGFYPLYYAAFAFAITVSFHHKDVYGCWYLFKDIPTPIRTVVCTVFSTFAINFGGLFFSSLTIENGLQLMSNTNYFGWIWVGGLLALSKIVGLASIAKKMERKATAVKEAARGGGWTATAPDEKVVEPKKTQ